MNTEILKPKKNSDNLLNYNAVISLFNETYPNNMLVIEEYLVDGSINETDQVLDDFINNFTLYIY